MAPSAQAAAPKDVVVEFTAVPTADPAGKTSPSSSPAPPAPAPSSLVNPEEAAGFFSTLFMSWLSPFVMAGYARPLTMSDALPLHTRDVPHLNYEAFLKNYEGEVWSAIKLTFGRTFVLSAVTLIFAMLVTLALPLLLRQLIRFVEASATEDPPPLSEGLFIVLGMTVLSLVDTTCKAHAMYWGKLVGVGLRNITMRLVYTGCYTISPRASLSGEAANNDVGKLVNQMAADAQRYLTNMPALVMMITAPATILLTITILLVTIGPSVLVGLVIMLLYVPLIKRVGLAQKACQGEKMKRADERVRVTNEVITGIRVLKFFAWEEPSQEIVAKSRAHEAEMLLSFWLWQALSTTSALICPVLAFVATFLTYYLVHKELPPLGDTFMALSMFKIIQLPFKAMSEGISATTQSLVGFTRLEEFLNQPRVPRREVTAADSDVMVKFSGRYSWGADADDASGACVNVSQQTPLVVRRGQILTVVGRVGSGKSSLIAAMLGELDLEGSSPPIPVNDVNGSAALVSQQAFIMNANVILNITFGLEYDEARFREAIRVSELQADLEQLPDGELTEIGERGINLSGGQKMRVSIARAVYANADVVFMDDPLSSVDAHVGRAIFENCIIEHFGSKGTSLVFVTNALSYLSHPKIGEIVVLGGGGGGEIVERGTYTELCGLKGEFWDLSGGAGAGKYVAGVGGGGEKGGGGGIEVVAEVEKKEEGAKGKLITKEEHAKGDVPLATYIQYLLRPSQAPPNSSLCFFTTRSCVLLFLYVAVEGLVSLQDYWVGLWGQQDNADDLAFYAQIYIVMFCGLAAVVSVRSVMFSKFAVDASCAAHDNAIANVVRCPSWWFDVTPIGRILNRFALDLSSVDEQLPVVTQLALITTSRCILVVCVSCIPSWYMVIVFLPIVFVFARQREYFRRSSREVQRLLAVASSPVFQQLEQTLVGLPVIRAYGGEAGFLKEFDRRLELSTSLAWTKTVLDQWLLIRLTFVSCAVVTAVSLLVVVYADRLDAAVVGMVVASALNLSSELRFAVRFSTDMESKLNGFQRLEEYASELPKERPAVLPEDAAKASSGWIKEGRLEIKNLEMRYREGLELVLKGVSMELEGGMKCGVVGRTGSGKSSLMLALFRIVEASAGSISVDGVDIAGVGLDLLRKKIAIVPQDPVMFSGTIKSNLDPFDEYSEEVVVDALKKACIWDFVERGGGIDMRVENNGENFSVGQRQLVCLARAVCRDAKVVVFDEHSASIDPLTDKLITKTIKEAFADKTVLAIAHRISSIIDYDRVCVMDAGVIREFGKPQELKHKKGGLFAALCAS